MPCASRAASFPVPVMQLDEIVAEKLRALAQRDRPTDLSDLAMVLGRDSIDERRVRRLVALKFELVLVMARLPSLLP